MCRSKEQGGRRCSKHQQEWELLSEGEQQHILAMQEELKQAAARKKRTGVRFAPSELQALSHEQVTSQMERFRILGEPKRSTRSLREEIVSSEEAARNAANAHAAFCQTGGTVPRMDEENTDAKRFFFLTEAEDLELTTAAQTAGLPKAEYIRRQLLQKDDRRQPRSMGHDARQVREAWLEIDDETRANLVRNRLVAEQGLEAVQGRMRELEAVIATHAGSKDEKSFKLAGAAMREKKLLALSEDELKEQRKKLQAEQLLLQKQREESAAQLRTLLVTAMQVLSYSKHGRHLDAFIYGFGTFASRRA